MACSSQVPNVSGSAIKVKPGVDIWNPNVSVEQLFEGEVKGRLLLDKLFELYQVGEGRKTLRFFKDGTENNHNIPFSEKPKNLARHMEYNPRHQAGVKMQYVKSVKARGIVESVRGECWAIAPAENDGRPAPYLLLSCASLVEAYYTAIAEEPNNENLIATAKKGMEARVLSIRTPASVCRYLTTLHNQFHHGASTNFLELIRIVDTALAVWKHNQGLTWKVENYESKCANYVKTHPEFGEVFPDWRLFEGARGCHQVLVTKRGQSFFDNMWDEFGQTVDFMHGRLANTVVLQCMQHVATSIIQTIYDGMSESDVNLLLMECLRLCVPQLGDDDDRAWVFDSVPKKQLVHRLFTAMNGSVTAVGGKTDGATNTRKRKASGNAPKAKAKARRTPAGSAAQGAGANEPDVNIPSDPRLNVTTIDCQYGVRNKLWLDDLMQCASHTVSSLQSQFGNFLDAETLDKTKVGIIRLGLRFAFCGDVTVTTKKGTKKYSKWSLLRPALQAHGVYLVTQVLKQHMAEIIQTGASDSHQDHAQLQELTSDPAVMFSDKTVSMNDKLIRFAAALDGWFRNEPTKILSTPQPLRVSDHASFGQLKATLLTSCTCSATTGAATSQAQSACMFHCSDPDLKDVLYQVCRCVHSTFSDSWACFVNIFLESCISGWAAPTGLEQYQLEAKHARPLSSMRATYMIQLLVDLCAKTAKSTTWANLFARLDERETQSSLVTLDSCSINGLQEFCSMWSEALECLARSSAANPVDLPAILAKAEVKPMTKEAIKLSGKTSSTNPDDAAAEDNAESPSVFSVKELAEFGQSDLVPAADQLFQLRWMISAKLIEAARTTTDANWDKLSLNITTSESKGKSTDAASLDVEILYQLTAADEIMVSPVDENVRYWKATNLTLVFFGDIGEYIDENASGPAGKAVAPRCPQKPVTYHVLVPNESGFCYVKRIGDTEYAMLRRGLLPGECFKTKKSKAAGSAAAPKAEPKLNTIGPLACFHRKNSSDTTQGEHCSPLLLKTAKDCRHLVK
ncbi:unnamed protein product [Cladocopium goreaui]|uniref:Uncharacterized protein n=1 Tax=Cladocopium goreaui TaxID=2562237 RepID=A0A9P1DHH6_9DINO|nr:unnamed protein product [Cladocopium goreaui]